MEWQQKFQIRDEKADLILTRIFPFGGIYYVSPAMLSSLNYKGIYYGLLSSQPSPKSSVLFLT